MSVLSPAPPSPVRVPRVRPSYPLCMARKTEMSAAPFVPESHDLQRLKAAVEHCRGCPLYENATQAVFGEGPDWAEVVFLGEKPGDKEDRSGKPFVGPAGRLLDKSLVSAGIPRERAYVTNAVKHFKWEPQGGRRLHKKPTEREIAACRPWLRAEMAILQPKVLVCLGASAAISAFGRHVRLTDLRGTFSSTELSEATFVTVHPSALLRIPDPDERHHEIDRFVADLRRVAEKLDY